jgi:hypothetical protein
LGLVRDKSALSNSGLARFAVSSDYYATLGVSPSAEDVVIHAAYRALIRHYHPDSNPDPEAHARAGAITAAYAVLRDPAKRAAYDAGQLEGTAEDWWSFEERRGPPARPPAMRGVGIAAAALAVLSVGLVWAWPQREQPLPPTAAVAKQQPKAAREPSRPVIELEPESERLARLGGIPTVLTPTLPTPPEPVEQVRIEPLPQPVSTVRPARDLPIERAATAPKPQPVAVKRVATAPAPAPKAPTEAPKVTAARPSPPSVSPQRLAALQRVSVGFYNQSLQHADEAKKTMLLGAHSRFMTQQGACQSDSCLADSYLHQIREVSAIMENRASASQ